MSGPRFGVWAPVYGNHGARLHPDDLPDASYRCTRDLLAGLVGSYEQVIERIDAFHEAGIDLFMLQFQPIESELDRFADHIISHYR
ncbi:hypothetical protein [Mycolicibacterium sp. CH28]|uniref:hypothetical protein n=1 Tax=Mycolicibacterium sp. CH28 TaxID=2512237 RepID=UPI0026CF375B